MDRSLEESIGERRRSNYHSSRLRRQDYPRDGVRKSANDNRTNLDNDWVHDRFDEDDRSARFDSSRRRERHWSGPERGNNRDRRDRELEEDFSSAKIRVGNLHYDITEDELHDLFQRIAPVDSVKLTYDRAGRSSGTAYVIYPHVADARAAIREFGGANAKGQPIRLELVGHSGPGGGRSEPRNRRDNLFDRIENPKSLFDRVEAPGSHRREARSLSPENDRNIDSRRDGASRRLRGSRRAAAEGNGEDADLHERRSDVRRPAPDGIDRYVPGQDSRRKSPAFSRNSTGAGRNLGRRPGERRERATGDGGYTDSDGHRLVGGRPRKTQEELDAEMEDYWGNTAVTAGGAEGAAGAPASTVATDINSHPGSATAIQSTATNEPADDDIDMIE